MFVEGEGIVLTIIVLSFALWCYIRYQRWLNGANVRKLPFISEAAPISENLSQLLQDHGFVAIGGKLKIPFHIFVDERELRSRLFIDGFAQRDNELYVIRLHRPRAPLEWTGSGVREKLLPYALIYQEAVGVLYIDEANREVKVIKFAWELD